jgi:hypothetical protein
VTVRITIAAKILASQKYPYLTIPIFYSLLAKIPKNGFLGVVKTL